MNTGISVGWTVGAILAVILFSTRALPYSDQITTERILRENRRFVEFINVCLTNFSDAKRDDLRKAYEKHFNADVAYLQSDYRRAFKQVYASQGEMEKLYRDMVKDFYLEDSKSILDKLAPVIIRSKNARAKLYLTLGYRDRTVGWTHYTAADSSNPKLHSFKLYKYVDAINMTRRAKRYAFLSLFESQSMDSKKKIYNQLCKAERNSNNPFFNRFIDLKEEEYIKEMDKLYDEKSEGTTKLSDLKKAEEEKKEGQPKKEKAPLPDETGGEAIFEKKVEKSVRFKNEIKTARYLINGEFDKAEDIMRTYIDDFNFKLINATFEALSAPGGDGVAEKVDYDKFKIHLADNYSRFVKKSLLEGLIDSIRVEDFLAEKNRDKQKTEERPGDTAGKGDKTAVPDKKEAEAKKQEGGAKPKESGVPAGKAK